MYGCACCNCRNNSCAVVAVAVMTVLYRDAAPAVSDLSPEAAVAVMVEIAVEAFAAALAAFG